MPSREESAATAREHGGHTAVQAQKVEIDVEVEGWERGKGEREREIKGERGRERSSLDHTESLFDRHVIRTCCSILHL